MILKFRDAHIAKLEKTQKKNDLVITSDERDKEVVRFQYVFLTLDCMAPLCRDEMRRGS